MKVTHLAIIAGFAAPGWVLAAGMAGEQAGMAGGDIASFDSLDTNADGYISAEEAQQHDRLYNAWQDVDVDANNQVDRAEFSAFEAGVETPTQPSEPGMDSQPMESPDTGSMAPE